MRIGIATDHGGLGLKKDLVAKRKAPSHAVVDFAVRAALIHGHFGAKPVEDEHTNLPCIGGRTVGLLLAWDFVETSLKAKIQPGAAPSRTIREGCPSRRGEIRLILERKSGGSLCAQR